jgi:Tfp pilus assembly PilM family ATPase
VFKNGLVATGIDIGSVSVKLVRGVGSEQIDRITHVGSSEWSPQGSDIDRASDALKKVLGGLNLTRSQLGHVAAGIDGSEIRFREVVMPPLTEAELRQALPFESRKHLDLEEISSPIVDAQILGPAPPAEEGGPEQIRVLLAAAPRSRRDFVLQVLARLGIEPEVVDLAPLAALNALFASPAVREIDPEQALALLDLGGRHATVHIASRSGGLLSRVVGDPASAGEPPDTAPSYADRVTGELSQTLTFFRGRHRQVVAGIFVAGGGADTPGLCELLQAGLDRPVTILDPMEGAELSAPNADPLPAKRARFVTACGLCRWWDTRRV